MKKVVAGRILVVDDQPANLRVVGALLSRNGYEVLSAANGEQALAIASETLPDLILLDVLMPGMDGFEVATLVRHDERLKDLPIVMITSRTGEKHRDRALSIGVNEYLGKPYQESVLLEAIQRLVHADV